MVRNYLFQLALKGVFIRSYQEGGITMSKNIYRNRRKPNMLYPLAMILFACLMLPAPVSLASNPYEMLPTPDGFLAYKIIPIPGGLLIEKDVMVTMLDGVRLACNVVRPDKPGKFPVIMSMTPYGKDQTPPAFKADGSPLPTTYANFIDRIYAHGVDLGHMKISMLASFEAPDPAFWVANDYVVVIVDRRGGFKSQGKLLSMAQEGDDLSQMIEWAATQEWSSGNVGLIGVSALARDQYYAASKQPPPPHLKAIVPWEGFSDSYRDSGFWGGIPETNFTKRDIKASIKKLPPDEAAKVWAAAIDHIR